MLAKTLVPWKITAIKAALHNTLNKEKILFAQVTNAHEGEIGPGMYARRWMTEKSEHYCYSTKPNLFFKYVIYKGQVKRLCVTNYDNEPDMSPMPRGIWYELTPTGAVYALAHTQILRAFSPSQIMALQTLSHQEQLKPKPC